MSLTGMQMAETFGCQLISACTRVSEELVVKNSKWEMTRTFLFADGATQSFSEPDCPHYYTVLPASPGWEALQMQLRADGSQEELWRRPIVAWRYNADRDGASLVPVWPGYDGVETTNTDEARTRCLLKAPDGRVMTLFANDMGGDVFDSTHTWAEWAHRKWSKDREAEAKRRAPCPHCGARVDDIPF